MTAASFLFIPAFNLFDSYTHIIPRSGNTGRVIQCLAVHRCIKATVRPGGHDPDRFYRIGKIGGINDIFVSPRVRFVFHQISSGLIVIAWLCYRRSSGQIQDKAKCDFININPPCSSRIVRWVAFRDTSSLNSRIIGGTSRIIRHQIRPLSRLLPEHEYCRRDRFALGLRPGDPRLINLVKDHRNQNSGQNGDDRRNDDDFYQRKTAASSHDSSPHTGTSIKTCISTPCYTLSPRRCLAIFTG